MQTIVINDPGICLFVTMAEWIDVLLGMKTPGDPWNIVLDGGPHPLMARQRGFDAALTIVF